jgi:hypothetical protein
VKYFCEMVAHVKQHGLTHYDHVCTGNHSEEDDEAAFFHAVKKAQVFVFAPQNEIPEDLEMAYDELGKVIREKLDSPFAVFSMEVLGQNITVPAPGDKIKVTIHCVLAYELHPKEFAYYVYASLSRIDGIQKIVYSTSTVGSIVNALVYRINSESLGTEKVNKILPLPAKGGRKSSIRKDHVIKRLIHVRPKRDQIATNPLSSRSIDWTHRWFQRGHWRNLVKESLGKDRDGDYCVQGKTWVSECTKGPKDKPIVGKVRFVHTEEKRI